MKITYDLSTMLAVLTGLAFVVNIIVQMTKSIIKIPTKLWCIIVSVCVNLGTLFGASPLGIVELNVTSILIAAFGAFIVAYISMYGFDTFKSLWDRFKRGDNINEN